MLAVVSRMIICFESDESREEAADSGFCGYVYAKKAMGARHNKGEDGLVFLSLAFADKTVARE